MKRFREILYYIVIFFIFFSIYYWISVFILEDKDFYHLKPIFFAEKARIVLEGVSPRLEYIGFVYPPLVFTPFLLFRDLPAAVSTLSAIVSLLIFTLTIRKSVSLLFTLLFFSPLLIYIATQRPDLYISFFLIALSTRMLASYFIKRLSVYLFISGLLLGLSFFTDFRVILLLPFFLLSTFFFYRRLKDWEIVKSVLIVYLTPVIAFLLMWIYLNWLFTGNPFHFVESPYSYFKTLAPLGDSERLINFILLNAIAGFIYFAGFFYLKDFRDLYSLPVYFIYFIPIIFQLISIKWNLIDGFLVNSALFLLFFLFFNNLMKLDRKIIPLVLINFISLVFIPKYSPNFYEKNFTKIFLFEKSEKNLVPYMEVANLLDTDNRCVLMDDADNFPIVYFSKNIKKFILPYRNEFYTVLSSPSLFTNWIVFNKKSEKDIVKRLFEKERKLLRSFKKSMENNIFVVLLNAEKRVKCFR